MSHDNAMIKTIKGLLFVMIIPIFWMVYGAFNPPAPAVNPTPSVSLSSIKNWPPELNKEYPDLKLYDHIGRTFQLSDFKGRVIVIEPIGMNCPACQAFSGAHKYGPFRNSQAQKNVPSFDKIFYKYIPELEFNDRHVIFVQLLIYDMNMKHPGPNDAINWGRHFRISSKKGHFTAVSLVDLRGQDSYKMIPGFQLIDRQFILRADSTGHNPQDDLYYKLLPLLDEIMYEPTRKVR